MRKNELAAMNHARHAHRGRPTEMAFAPRRWNPNARAVAAGPARSLSDEAKAAWAASHGFALATR
jgi:hypothetical protein